MKALIPIVVSFAIMFLIEFVKRYRKNQAIEKKHLAFQQEWRTKTLDYVKKLNAFIAKGVKDGWESAGEEPKDPGREHLAPYAITHIMKANETENFAELREKWPPAHAPLVKYLEKKGQAIPALFFLPDDSIIAYICDGSAAKTVQIKGDSVTTIDGIGLFGRCPNRRFFAIAKEKGIQITDRWLGNETAFCPWPTGLEDVPEKLGASPWQKPPTPEQIIPFPCGTRVLVASSNGVHVLSKECATRLLPTTELLLEEAETEIAEDEHNQLLPYLSMAHGAISPDGTLIAVGHQDSQHLVFNDKLEQIATIGMMSSYPHYALFNKTATHLAFNSCHFYNGITIAAPTDIINGLQTEEYEEDSRVPQVEEMSRVYAGTSRDDNFIIGDAYGYVRAFTPSGKHLWQHFVGSTIGAIDTSADGSTMAVSSCAGFISIFKLDAGKQAPHQVGDGGNEEFRRWIFWKGEKKPLIW